MVIVLEELDFGWEWEEINKVEIMWLEGKGLEEMANEIKRDGDEVFLLLMHLARQGRIGARQNFIWQERMQLDV